MMHGVATKEAAREAGMMYTVQLCAFILLFVGSVGVRIRQVHVDGPTH